MQDLNLKHKSHVWFQVKDMGEIIEVLGTLEVLPVTKELLEVKIDIF